MNTPSFPSLPSYWEAGAEMLEMGMATYFEEYVEQTLGMNLKFSMIDVTCMACRAHHTHAIRVFIDYALDTNPQKYFLDDVVKLLLMEGKSREVVMFLELAVEFFEMPKAKEIAQKRNKPWCTRLYEALSSVWDVSHVPSKDRAAYLVQLVDHLQPLTSTQDLFEEFLRYYLFAVDYRHAPSSSSVGELDVLLNLKPQYRAHCMAYMVLALEGASETTKEEMQTLAQKMTHQQILFSDLLTTPIKGADLERSVPETLGQFLNGKTPVWKTEQILSGLDQLCEWGVWHDDTLDWSGLEQQLLALDLDENDGDPKQRWKHLFDTVEKNTTRQEMLKVAHDHHLTKTCEIKMRKI